jgi:hypothetical protein
VLLIVPACSSNQPRSTQAASEQRSTQATQAPSDQQANSTDQMKNERDEYVKSMEARLAEFDKNVDGLEKKAGAMTGAAESNYKNDIDQLKTARKDVEKKLDDLKEVSAESWMTMKGEVDSAMSGLENSYEQVSNRNPEKTPAR